MELTTNKQILELRAAFFDMAHSPFIIFDQDLRFLDANEISLKTLGLDKVCLIGRMLKDVIPGVEKTEAYAIYQEVIRTGKPANVENVELFFGQSKFIFSVKAFKIGAGVGLAMLNTTSLTNTIEKLEETSNDYKKLNHKLCNRNKELQELSYVTAHDLKAPVANMECLLDFLEEENLIDDGGWDLFYKAKSVNQLMGKKLKTLGEIITFKSILNNQREILFFDSILNKIKIEISEKIKNKQAIIESDFTACPSIEYGSIRLHSVIFNVLSNSLKYSHPKRVPVIKIWTKKENGKNVFYIKDNGIGFDLELGKEKIFGLFQRMHTHVDGLGVGLYMVESIVRANGGSIEIDSKLDVGTTFKIYL